MMWCLWCQLLLPHVIAELLSILSILILIIEVVDCVFKRMNAILLFSFHMVYSAIHLGQFGTVTDWMFVVTIVSITVFHVAVHAVSLASLRADARR